MSNNKNTGNWGEEQALAFLRNNNFTILTSNWRFKKLEVDIIALHQNQIVFIEVKTRSGEDAGEPEESVTLKKQRFLIQAANAYILQNNIELEARFDIVAITVINGEISIRHLQDAFYPIVK